MEQTFPSVAVIGCGYWGKNLVRNFAEVGALAAVCDESIERASQLGRQYNVSVQTLEAVLQDTSIDAAAVATPVETHSVIARKALQAGKHVFVEKPIALDIGAAEELSELSKEQARVLMVGHLLQYHPAFLRLKQLVAQGDLGRLRHIHSCRLNLGSEENVLWGFAPHDVSMILSLVGSEPARVFAVGDFFRRSRVADALTIHLSFPGGENAHVFLSWLYPCKERKLVVVGDEGMAVFDDTQKWDRKLLVYQHKIAWKNGKPTPDKAIARAVVVTPTEPLKQEVAHFLDCIAGNTSCRTDASEAMRVLKVLKASEQDIRESLSSEWNKNK